MVDRDYGLYSDGFRFQKSLINIHLLSLLSVTTSYFVCRLEAMVRRFLVIQMHSLKTKIQRSPSVTGVNTLVLMGTSITSIVSLVKAR